MSLSKWLKDLGLGQIIKPLEDFGITTVRDLSVLHPSELRDIVGELNLKTGHRIKLTVAVRKFEANEAPRIVLTPEEDKAIKHISNATKDARSILTKVEKTMEGVKQNAQKSRKDVTAEFARCISQLKKREKELIGQINKSEQQKLSILEKQSMELSGVVGELTRGKIDTEKLMRISSIDDISTAGKSVAANVAKAVQFELPTKPATNPDISFRTAPDILRRNIKRHGEVLTHAPSKPPLITKLIPDLNNIKVIWELNVEPGTSEKLLPISVGIQLTELSSNSQEGATGLRTEFESEGKENEYIIKDLKKDTNYNVAVRSKNQICWSSYGEVTLVKTLSGPPPPPAKGKRWELTMSAKTHHYRYNRDEKNTYGALTDGTAKTCAATACGSNQFIMATFAEVVTVSSVTLSHTSSSAGWDIHVSNGYKIQYEQSSDIWKDLATVTGITEHKSKRFCFAPVNLRRIRLFRSTSGYVVTAHFGIE